MARVMLYLSEGVASILETSKQKPGGGCFRAAARKWTAVLGIIYHVPGVKCHGAVAYIQLRVASCDRTFFSSLFSWNILFTYPWPKVHLRQVPIQNLNMLKIAYICLPFLHLSSVTCLLHCKFFQRSVFLYSTLQIGVLLLVGLSACYLNIAIRKSCLCSLSCYLQITFGLGRVSTSLILTTCRPGEGANTQIHPHHWLVLHKNSGADSICRSKSTTS